MIATVEAMALANHQPPMVNGISFEWAPGIPIDDNDTGVNLHQPDEIAQNNAEVARDDKFAIKDPLLGLLNYVISPI